MSDHDDDATCTGRIIFHLVHGTWAEDAPWTRRGSLFQKRLQQQLRDKHGMSEEIEFTAPRWGVRTDSRRG